MGYDQNNTERVKDQLHRGLITADQANVQLVRNERFRVITRLSRDVRNALNTAVKTGELKRMKKEGKKPEIYYHPDFEYLANDTRNKIVAEKLAALAKICV